MQYRKRYKRIAAALVWAALASFAHAADALPEAAKALKKNATVQAVPAPPHINRQVASQHIATARAKAIAPAVQAQAQVNAYPPLTVTTQPMPTLPAAVTQARSKAAAAQQQPVQQRSTATTTSFTPPVPDARHQHRLHPQRHTAGRRILLPLRHHAALQVNGLPDRPEQRHRFRPATAPGRRRQQPQRGRCFRQPWQRQ